MLPVTKQAPNPRLRLVTAGCHQEAESRPAEQPADLTVALAGQPNVGKSTVFNMLTGLNQHVGNWPGKTIEQKTGTLRYNQTVLHLVDLPGTYSLTANSEEERIARDYLIHQRPDVVIALVNAAALERSLYLVAELIALGRPLVIGLNMMDVAQQHGISVEPHVLSAALGVPVVPVVAAKNIGVRELVEAALEVAAAPDTWHPARPEIRPEHRPVLAKLSELLAEHITPPGAGAEQSSPVQHPLRMDSAIQGQKRPADSAPGQIPPSKAAEPAIGGLAAYPTEWLALKLLEGDTQVTALVRDALPPAQWDQVHALLLAHEDAFLDIASSRYEWIGRIMRAGVTQPRASAITHTDRLDRVATQPVLGLGLLLGIFGLVFWLTYTVATPITNWLAETVLAGIVGAAARVLTAAPAWLQGLVMDGLLGGVGTVLTFLPILVVFFAVLGILEDTGYLARGAYVMDRFMHLMGLHGKSFLPLFLGFGCNVPAVLGTRILEERRARLLTILLAPLVPCTARLTVIAFLTPAFFGAQAALVSWGLVALNLVMLAIAGILVNRLVFRGEQTAFIMELPLYHVPNLRTVGLYVWNNTLAFVKRAGTLILIASIAVWALASLPGGDIETSMLAQFGRWLTPLTAWMGLADWRIVVALLTSFFAKENTIATLGILFGMDAESAALATQVAAILTVPAQVAFLLVQMLFIPCLATVATIKQETASWRWVGASIGLLWAISFITATLAYQIGRLLMG
ncbi:MAG: ferrous iron transport protein B [Anaerolineae bacterium]